MRKAILWLGATAVTLGGCSTVMEAHRPDPVNLHQFSVGERRFDVVSQVGAPTANEMDGAESCDMYKLVTHGVSRLGKGAIILGEAAADVYTLGLFEVIATPTEGATRSAAHTVIFCYSPAKTLDFITESGPDGPITTLGEPIHRRTPAAAPTSPPTDTGVAAGRPMPVSATASDFASTAAGPTAARSLAAPRCGAVRQSNGVIKIIPC